MPLTSFWVFIINFEIISNLFLLFFFVVVVVDFEQVSISQVTYCDFSEIDILKIINNQDSS